MINRVIIARDLQTTKALFPSVIVFVRVGQFDKGPAILLPVAIIACNFKDFLRNYAIVLLLVCTMISTVAVSSTRRP